MIVTKLRIVYHQRMRIFSCSNDKLTFPIGIALTASGALWDFLCLCHYQLTLTPSLSRE